MPSRRQVLGAFGTVGVVSIAGLQSRRTLRAEERSTEPTEDSGQDRWPMYQRNAQHTGHQQNAGRPQTEPQTRWTFSTEDTVESSPAIVDDTAYVGDTNGIVYAIDLADGSDLWRFETPTGTGIRGSPAVDGDTIFVANTQLYALRSSDGSVDWTYDLISPAWSPVITEGTLFVATNSQGVYAIETDGELRWRFDGGDAELPLAAPVAASNDRVYFGTQGTAYSLDIGDGGTDWVKTIGELSSPITAAPVVDGDRVYFAVGTTLSALEATSGEVLWSFEADSAIVAPPTVINGKIFVGSRNGTLSALDSASGNQVWRASVSGITSPPTSAGSTVFVSATDGVVHAFKTGDIGLFDKREIFRADSSVGALTAPVPIENSLYLGGSGVIALR